MKITCKHCGSLKLEQHVVEVFEGYDDGEVFHTVVDYDMVKRESQHMAAPGYGRCATQINFQCQECEQHTVIGVSQLENGVITVQVI